MSNPIARAPANEWVSFTDPDSVSWLFDVTFLTSGWRCTFGAGCLGVEPGDNGARGCCAHGAHLVDEAEQAKIADLAERLDPSRWQNHDQIATVDELFTELDGDTLTAQIDDACVFLNGPDFEGGHGCALHLEALAAGERPLDWKPTVCWQLPFRLEYYEDDAGTQTVAVRAWRRSDWGAGGAAFGWWCTDELPAGGPPTWQAHLDELREMVGEWPLAQLVTYLGERETAETDVSIRAADRPDGSRKSNQIVGESTARRAV